MTTPLPMAQVAPFPTHPGPPLPGLKSRRRAGLVVYYDESCGLCTKAARLLDRLNWLGRIRFRQASEHPTAQGEQYVDMHATDHNGRIYRGFATYRQIGWRIPLLWCLTPLAYIWPISWIGRRLYRRVADSRECQTG